jgi:hypothetical protein
MHGTMSLGQIEHAVNQATGSRDSPAVKAIKRAVDEAIRGCLPLDWHPQSQLGGSQMKGTETWTSSCAPTATR